MTLVKITILCENRTCVTQDVVGEHGFCALVEKNGEKLTFKSGGGITFQSSCEHEYDEMVNKVYVPIY